MLFGMKHDQTEADLSRQSLGPVDAILVASDMAVSKSLTSINLSRNNSCRGGKPSRGISVSKSLTEINLRTTTSVRKEQKHSDGQYP